MAVVVERWKKMEKYIVIVIAAVLFTAGCVIGYVAREPETVVEIEYVDTVEWVNNTEYINNTYPVYNNITQPIYNNNTEWVNNTYPVYNNITEYSNNTEWINNTYYVTNETNTTTTTTPAGSWNAVGAESTTSGKLTFGMFTEDVSHIDIKIFVQANGTSIGDLTIPPFSGASPWAITWYSGPPGASATYFDYNGAGGLINSGDYITLTGLLPGTTYAFSVYHIPSSEIVSMTGGSGQFQTPV